MLKYSKLFIAVFLMTACKSEPVPTNEGFTCTSDQKKIDELSKLLEEQEVPFIAKLIVEDKVSADSNGNKTGLPVGDTCIYYAHKYGNIAHKISNQIVGKFPPIWGRSTSWNNRNDELIRKLARHNIITTVHTYRGKEWVAWPLEDVEKVEEILEYDQWKKEYNKKIRDEKYPPNQALNEQPSAATDAESGAR